jgi:hypothetical protein
MFTQLNPKRKIILFVLFLIFGIVSCKKEQGGSNTPTPPAPGTVSGSFTPTSAATAVSLDTVTGNQKYTVSPNTDGTFSFSSVLPGQYKLRVTPITIYNTPAQSIVTVTSGNNTSIPAITLTYNSAAQIGNINFTLSGTAYTIFNNGLFLNYASSIFNLTGGTPSTPSYYYLDLKLSGVNGTGDFNITTSASYISIFYYLSPGNAGGYWSTLNGGTGTVTITTLNTTTRTVSGTFSGTLAPQGASVGAKAISGTFTNVLY